MGSRVASKDGRLSLLSDWRGLCLAGKKHGMGIGFAGVDDGVDGKGNDGPGD